MKINQLFKEKLSEEALDNVLRTFNLKNLQDETSFTKGDLTKFRTPEKLEALKEQLRQYYLPCKYKIYFNVIDESKCITILRQILKLFQVKLLSRQKYIKFKKTTIYSIHPFEEQSSSCIKVEQQHHELVF